MATMLVTQPARLEPIGLDAQPVPLVCFSRVRWDFTPQRPQHLMSRCARTRPVAFFEQPRFEGDVTPRLEVSMRAPGVRVLVPVLPSGFLPVQTTLAQTLMVNDFLRYEGWDHYDTWYDTPAAFKFTRQLAPRLLVYDCMDELAGLGARMPDSVELEAALLARADVVFTGGHSLSAAKRGLNPHVHAIPSGVDVQHFSRAVTAPRDPADQAELPRPRLGFFGLIDERIDLELLAGIADARPDWHIVMLGPVLAIDPRELPLRANLHFLGPTDHAELPDYASGWDVGILPLARNGATRFVSPTKAPEYLAAGLPVVSTSICDVVRPYGEQGLVRIADTLEHFVAEVVRAMDEDARSPAWRRRVREALASTSWEVTWARMAHLIDDAHTRRWACAR